MIALLALSLLVASASALAPSPLATPSLARSHAATAFVGVPGTVRTQQNGARVQRISSGPVMGLFGLGWAEIGVIGVFALLFFGPDKLAPLAKDLGASQLSITVPFCVLTRLCCCNNINMHTGKSASGLKEVTEEFQKGMAEGDTGISNTGGEKAVAAEVTEVKEESSEDKK